MKTIAIILLLTLCGTSSAEISKITINKAWKRIAKADNFTRTAITYEKDSAPNAWVKSSGGNFTVHITKGLMRILDTEDEIAGVLAHELGHIRLGHYSNNEAPSMMRVTGINSDIQTLSTHTGAMTAKQEKEADDYGLRLLTKARYCPKGLYTALTKINATNLRRNEQNAFSSHPASKERLANVAEKAGITPGMKADSLIGMEDIADIMLGR